MKPTHLKCVPYSIDKGRMAITFAAHVDTSPGHGWYGRTTVEVPKRLVELPTGPGCAKVEVRLVDANEAQALIEIPGIQGIFKVPHVAITTK